MSALEQEIIDAISRLNAEQKQRVLDFVRDLDVPSEHYLSAVELMKLPFEERNRIAEDFEIF